MKENKLFGFVLLLNLMLPQMSMAEDSLVTSIPDSKNRIIKLTDVGVIPEKLTMKKEDSIVFFLNSSEADLVTLEIDYGKHTTHCASSNLKIEQGKVLSTRPIEPRNFASVCFHDAGKYPFKILGLKKNISGINGEIIVE